MTRSANAPTAGQINLPGQAAAPDGPNDLTGMFVMHWAFRRDLDRFAAAAIHTPVEDQAAWRALARRWSLFRHVLHDHHTGEDEGLWPALRSSADAAGAAVLDAMAAEHHDIDPLLASVAEGMDRMAATPDPDARAALEVRVVAARERLGRHLAHEERDALALIQRHLPPAEWERISKVYFERAKTPREVAALVAWVLHDLPEPAAARLLGGAAPVRVLWRLVLRRPFARRERRAFRYAG
ncbi:hemerythrin domain-containing protein [Dactylosporangium sp. NPDC048998]|uniref:hemerythrin domain-containing protein n=1 Tax=Dactylosporangium sp. NPDC048998 TaxID=3363976 RepID=UPI0037247DE4